MPSLSRRKFLAAADVLRCAERWVDARKPTLVTQEDVDLLGAVERWRKLRDKAPSDRPPRFDQEAPTEPKAKR